MRITLVRASVFTQQRREQYREESDPRLAASLDFEIGAFATGGTGGFLASLPVVLPPI